MTHDIQPEDSIVTIKRGGTKEPLLHVKGTGEFIFGENAHPTEVIEALIKAIPQGIMLAAERNLSEHQIMQLLAHKLKMEDKMLALVDVEKTEWGYFVAGNELPVPIDRAIITYGVEK